MCSGPDDSDIGGQDFQHLADTLLASPAVQALLKIQRGEDVRPLRGHRVDLEGTCLNGLPPSRPAGATGVTNIAVLSPRITLHHHFLFRLGRKNFSSAAKCD